ncbi:MAG: hypothetical protein J6Y48_17345, partial [Clostridia bacterium]|nr:hypothetical protein [Clostridia bacterium]
MFHAEIIFPGVTHITDAMGVSMTLIEGEQRAILFDTGYGTENVKAYVQTLTGKPVRVLKRLSVGGLILPEDLKSGEYRELDNS